jgi:hypothetical protein
LICTVRTVEVVLTILGLAESVTAVAIEELGNVAVLRTGKAVFIPWSSPVSAIAVSITTLRTDLTYTV